MVELLADAEHASTVGACGVRFCAGGGVTDVPLRELKELLVELDKIATGASRLALAAELSRRLGSLVGPLGSMTAFEPYSPQRLVLLRALDHLRNLGRRGELMTLRHRLLLSGAARPMPYKLKTRPDKSASGFWSSSPGYERGDRLVRGLGQEYRVVDVEAGDPPVLVVDDWRP